MGAINNNVIKQIVIMLLIAFLGIVIIWKLAYFIPGFLGATAIYIMFRSWYFKLLTRRGWKPWVAALTMIIGLLITMILPLFLMGEVLAPKINDLIANSEEIKSQILSMYNYVQEKFPQLNISREQILGFAQKGIGILPTLFNAMTNLVANLFTALFIAYFFFVGGRKFEQSVKSYLPIARDSRKQVWDETKNLVVSNAVGIPALAIAQGLIALLGYWICGVPGALLWGLLTAFVSVIPVIGTMAVWVPVCIYLFAQGETGYGIFLTIYCLIVVGFSDNVIRFLFLKKFGDVHPLITVFGVILGLNVFGVIGLIFGPLLLSYFIMLVKIYQVEFGNESQKIAP
ncbi:MAG: hypothetical protein BGO31_20085 [Bacteroidetes bacterium 43-16]|nr:MAG: hypothetical protein BGO31_20085 [Bacteroidetes bacterium 43-16]